MPGAWFTSARRPLSQQQPPRIKLFPLNGWTCDQRRQSTSHSLAPKRCHSSGEVRMIKPMFAVCYLNTLTQNRNQKREYHILIINGIFLITLTQRLSAAQCTDHNYCCWCDYLFAFWVAAILTAQVVVGDTGFLANDLTEHRPGSVTQQLHPPGLHLARQLVKEGNWEWENRGNFSRFPQRRRHAHCEETQTEGSDNCLAYERAATFTSAHHISFSLLSGTILRRLKGESFDVEKMKKDCVVRLGLITSNSVAKVFIFLFTDHSSCLECKSNWFNPIYLLISPTRTTFWLKIF